jgi:hypothetical protein
MAGTTIALVVKTEITDGIPKTMAVLTLTNPFKKSTDPTALVKPTIKSEYAVANRLHCEQIPKREP